MALHSTDQRVQQDGLAMYFMHYDYLRIHQTLRVAPAMAGGVTKQLSSMQDVVAMIEGMRSAGQLIVAVPRFHFQARRRLLFFLCQQLQQSATLVLICRFRQKLSKFSYVLLTDKLLHAIVRAPFVSACRICSKKYSTVELTVQQAPSA